MLVLLARELEQEQAARQRADALAHAELVNADILSLVAAARQLAVSVASVPGVAEHGSACRQQLLALRRSLSEYAFLAVLDADLRVLCSTDDLPEPTPGMLHIARRTLAVGGFAVDHFVREADRPPFLGFGMPTGDVSAPGSEPATKPPTGLVLGGIDLNWLGGHLATIAAPAGGTITLLDRDATVLARTPDNARWMGQALPGRLHRTEGSMARPDTAFVESLDGATRLFGYVPSAANPQGLAVTVSLPPASGAGLTHALQRSWVALGAFSVLSLLAALVLGERYISRPTTVLLDAVRRWSGGDFAARAVLDEASRTEFGSLARAFNTMAEGLGRQHTELERLNVSLETRVAERTRALSASHNRLQVEITERELSEAQLRQAQKLQAVGELAGGLAHDFNNLLTTVLGSLELLQRRIAATEERSRTLIAAAISAAERGGRLTAQLIAFSRKQRLLPLPSDLNAALGGMKGLIASTLGPGIRLETRLDPGLFPVLVDPNQLEAAILNLVLNARDAMSGSGGSAGTLRLCTARRREGSQGAAQGRDQGAARDVDAFPPGEEPLAPGEYAVLTVEDTGCGMPPEVVSRVFEPFFTTKGPGRGSGLGLSQVHGLAHQSGGSVEVASRVGEGTRVRLLLPRATVSAGAGLLPGDAADLPARPGLARPGHGAGGHAAATLLLVDDEADVREVTAETLGEAGYHVLVASGGAEALGLLQHEAVDLLLADYAMPGMTGIELIRAARGAQPDLPVMLVTGYAELGDVAEMDGLSPHHVVRKPFRAAELLRRVEAALGRVTEPV